MSFYRSTHRALHEAVDPRLLADARRGDEEAIYAVILDLLRSRPLRWAPEIADAILGQFAPPLRILHVQLLRSTFIDLWLLYRDRGATRKMAELLSQALRPGGSAFAPEDVLDVLGGVAETHGYHVDFSPQRTVTLRTGDLLSEPHGFRVFWHTNEGPERRTYHWQIFEHLPYSHPSARPRVDKALRDLQDLRSTVADIVRRWRT